MHRSRVGLVFALLATLGIWGCAQNPGAESERSARTTRLQEEIRGLSAQRDQLKKELKSAGEEVQRLKEELDQVVKSRDELRDQLAARTSERDAGYAQLDQLRRGIRALMEQAETATAPIAPTVGRADSASIRP